MKASSWVPPSPPESAAAAGHVLLDRWCYIADLPNDTTAHSTTSTGLPITLTFRAARPPHLSHFCVHCPGLDFSCIAPKIIATHAHLVLLCVPLHAHSCGGGLDWDYFVYSPRAQGLDLLPNPSQDHHTRCIHSSATALISRGASYAVAALGVCIPRFNGNVLIRWDLRLHLYRSSSSHSSSKGSWITKTLSVNEFPRDELIPFPGADARLYHKTGKTITIGGKHGTVAWVDLWRGIFFCDVLRKRPRLRDVPLPVPARGNWDRLLWGGGDPNLIRDVTISRNKDSIKYVELEFMTREVLLNDATTPADDVSYADWVRNLYSRKSQVVRDGWKFTTWNMAIAPAVIGEWHRDCAVDVKDIRLDASSDPCLPDLAAMLSSKISRPLRELPVAYPILSMDDDDVVYLLSQTRTRDNDELAVMVAIDVRKATLRGFAELDVQKFNLLANYFISEICRGT